VDWAERPAISGAHAYGLVTRQLARQREHDLAWCRYQAAAEEWVRGRDEAYGSAGSAAAREAMRAQGGAAGGGVQRQRAREAAEAAAAEFERRHPAPVWNGGTPCAQPRYSASVDPQAGVL